MRIEDALKGIDIPRADAEVILSAILQRDRAWLLAHGQDELSEKAWTAWGQAVSRRRRLEPVAYITGHQEFYGRPFTVSPHVMIPRPSTEGLVEFTLNALRGSHEQRHTEIDTDIVAWTQQWDDLHDVRTLVDIGTGSGCIAITLACELPDFRVFAGDISPEALAVAEANARHNAVQTRVTFRQGSLLAPFADLTEPFIVVSNPPYIPRGRPLMRDVVDYEPHVALFGGPEGQEIVSELTAQARAHPYCRAFFIECHRAQMQL